MEVTEFGDDPALLQRTFRLHCGIDLLQHEEQTVQWGRQQIVDEQHVSSGL
jgi:hypothetical protein